MNKKLIIIGSKGNGSVVASTVSDINEVLPTWDLLGFLDDRETGLVNGLPVLGTVDADTVSPYLEDQSVYFYWALVSTRLRETFISRLHDLGIPKERFATLIHPTAVVSKYAHIGYGVSIQPLVNVGPGVRVGNHVHVFAQAMLGHDASLEDFSYVANNGCVGGNVKLEQGAYVGTNASIRENLILGKWSMVGMGSVVLKSVEPYTTVVGNPARILSK